MLENFDLLAATLAHEIKNPLALVRANLDYMELCDTEKRHANSYSMMKRQLESADSILRDFVGMMSSAGGEGRAGAGNDPRADACEIIRGVAADYMTRPGLEISLDIPPSLNVRCNGKLLKIVLSNAVKNAAEADAGRVTIRAARAGGLAELAVTDDGRGLTEEELCEVGGGGGFTTKQYGNGLGVLISRRIVEGSGGSYSIGNAAGGGCEVAIKLELFGE